MCGEGQMIKHLANAAFSFGLAAMSWLIKPENIETSLRIATLIVGLAAGLMSLRNAWRSRNKK
jgi:hypothetical protein